MLLAMQADPVSMALGIRLILAEIMNGLMAVGRIYG